MSVSPQRQLLELQSTQPYPICMTALNESQIKTIELFVSHPRGRGYVLDHSDQSFSTWFYNDHGIDIDAPKYQERGSSKRNRLITFCLLDDQGKVRNVLHDLYVRAIDIGIGYSEEISQKTIDDFSAIISSLDFAPHTNHTNGPSLNANAETIANNFRQNRSAIDLLVAGTLETISEFKEVVRSDNLLAVEKPETKEKLLGLLEALSVHLQELTQLIPPNQQNLPQEAEVVIERWTERYVNGALPKLEEYVAPEALGRSSVPISLILFCGSLGAILTGFSSVGFAAGSVVGKMLVGEMKGGAAADKITESYNEEQ